MKKFTDDRCTTYAGGRPTTIPHLELSAQVSLHLAKCHIVGNHMSLLKLQILMVSNRNYYLGTSVKVPMRF